MMSLPWNLLNMRRTVAAFCFGYLFGYATLFWMSPHFHKPGYILYDTKNSTSDMGALRLVHNVAERSAGDCAKLPVGRGQLNMMNKFSYILVLYYFEQMNNAMRNLLHLGPVAMNLDLKIVEPFVVHSRLYGLPDLLPPGEVTGKFYSLRTLFNIDTVNKSLYSYANTTLASFEEFVLYAPRDIVVVYFIHKEYYKPRSFRLLYRHGRLLKLVSEAESPVIDCTNEIAHEEQINGGLLGTLLNISAKYGAVNFRIVKFICAAGEREITTDQLREQLGPKKKTVIFPEWRGCAYKHCNLEMRHQPTIHSRTRVLYKLKGEKQSPLNVSYVNSDTVMETASLFIKNLNLTKKPYISVYMRIEKLIKTKNTFHINESYLNCCTSVLRKVLANIKKRYQLTNVLLITDLGKYGSDACPGDCQVVGTELLRNVEKVNNMKAFSYDPSRTPLKIDNSGFAAMVEMEMLARARRLITVGFGLFKEQVTQLYAKRKGFDNNVYAICREQSLNTLYEFKSFLPHC